MNSLFSDFFSMSKLSAEAMSLVSASSASSNTYDSLNNNAYRNYLAPENNTSQYLVIITLIYQLIMNKRLLIIRLLAGILVTTTKNRYKLLDGPHL